MKNHRLELADVFRSHQKDFLARWNHVLSRQHRRALKDIQNCRTAALGGHLQQCGWCGHRVLLYNSCRNRHCPKCQARARVRWLAQRQTELLPVPYFHVVFHTIAADRPTGVAKRQTDLQPPLSRRLPGFAGNRGRPATAGRLYRLPGRASHLGAEPTFYTRTCIASYRAAASHTTAPAGSPAASPPSSYPCACSAAAFGRSSCDPSGRHSRETCSTSMVNSAL